MRCSVVVPTCGRPELLVRCLEAVAGQTLGADRYEVVVVDDGVEERTRRAVASVATRARVPVRYVAMARPRGGPAAARNAGWRAAHGEVIAFTDDDTIPDADWLARGLVAVDRGADVVEGRIVVPLPPRPTDHERDTAGLETAGFVTANCLVRREALAAVGGLDERFAAAWREDSDLLFRLLDAGFRHVRAPDAVVVHPARPAPWGISVRQQRKSQWDALLYREHPRRFREMVRPLRPTSYYPTVAALVVAVASAASGLVVAARLAFLCWLVLTIAFAARRLRGASRDPAHVLEMVVTSMLIPPLSLFWRIAGGVRHRVLFW